MPHTHTPPPKLSDFMQILRPTVAKEGWACATYTSATNHCCNRLHSQLLRPGPRSTMQNNWKELRENKPQPGHHRQFCSKSHFTAKILTVRLAAKLNEDISNYGHIITIWRYSVIRMAHLTLNFDLDLKSQSLTVMMPNNSAKFQLVSVNSITIGNQL